MLYDKKIEGFMAKVFDAVFEEEREGGDPAEYERRRQDFAFHMTDWASEIEQMMALQKNLDEADPEEAATFIIGFLYHVVPHLNAAGRLLLDEIPDPFAKPLDAPTAPAPRGG
jgi:hypothetical protein